MNEKRFRSSNWFLGWFFTFVLLLAVLLLIIPNVAMFILFHDDYINENALKVIFTYTMAGIMIATGIFLIVFWFFTINAFWCWLLIEEDRIVFTPVFKKDIIINFDDCIHVGIADWDKDRRHQGLYDAISETCESRGDDGKYIYITVASFPEKYRHRINRVISKKGFIKFPYDDEVCLALMEAIPARTGELRAFYNRMQWNDKKIAKENENKLKKKLKKKEMKKRAKGQKNANKITSLKD